MIILRFWMRMWHALKTQFQFFSVGKQENEVTISIQLFWENFKKQKWSLLLEYSSNEIPLVNEVRKFLDHGKKRKKMWE